MLDGPGQSIQFALDRRIGYPLDDGALVSIRASHRWMRDALEEAYALAAAAQLAVGEFDYAEETRAHTLAQQYDDANGQANDREGVFGKDITREEANARRARAVASVADLKAQARLAQATIADKWKAWRKAMVRQLLQPQKDADSALQAAPTGNTAIAPVVAGSATNAPVVPFKKAVLIAAHSHEWPTIQRDIGDAHKNGLATAAKAGARGWWEDSALIWARANGKLINAAKPAVSLAQAMHNLADLPSQKHTI